MNVSEVQSINVHQHYQTNAVGPSPTYVKSCYTTESDLAKDYLVSERFRSQLVVTTADSTGWRPPTNFDAYEYDHSPWIGTTHWRDKNTKDGGGGFCSDGSGYTFTGCLSNLSPTSSFYAVPLLPPLALFSDALREKAINAAYAKLKDQKVNYGVFAAEASTASAMIAKNTRAVYNAYKNVRKGDMKAAYDALRVSTRPATKRWHKPPKNSKEASSRWLEMQYGWMPLVSDIYGAIQDVNAGLLREPRVTARVMRTDEVVESIPVAPGPFYNGMKDVNRQNLVLVRLDFAIDLPILQQFINKGLTNPVEIAWELVPFSFVVDWFTSIGDYLSTLDAHMGLVWKGGSVTEREIYSVTAFATATPIVPKADHVYQKSASITTSSRRKTVKRTAYPAPPSGGIYLSNPFSLVRAVNAAALFHQFRK